MFSDIFIRRPKLAIVISLVILLAGALCIFKIPIAEYPEVVPPEIIVRATYPGASAQVLVNTVAAPIESEVNGIEHSLYFTSTSDDYGNYELRITFNPGSNGDIDQVNVQNAVQRAEPFLPREVVDLGISIKKQTSDILGVFIFTSKNNELSKLFLSNYVSINVKDTVARVDGVSNVTIFGALDYSMRIWLKPIEMSAFNLTPADIVLALRSQNIQAATGSIGTENSSDFTQYKINTLGRLNTVEQFGDIIVKSGKSGRQVKLKDVADIELGASRYTGNSYYNGKEAVVMAIYRNHDANALKVVKAVKDEINKLSQHFPKGMTYSMAYEPTKFVTATMHEIVSTLILTLFLVIFITYIFLQDWKATLIPAATIPVSLIGTFIVLYFLGYSANVLTLFGLILSIGSVVDDAIVVVENVTRLIEEGLSPKEAAYKSMRQVTNPVIATTLVLLAVFAPIGFYEGMVGTIYLQFAITMCTALILSTINALTLSPALCGVLLRPHRPPRGVFKYFNKLLNFSSKKYLGVVGFFMRRAFLTFIIFAAIIAGDIYYFKVTPRSFLPKEDKGAIFCSVQLPPDATLSRTNKVLLQTEEKIRKIPGIENVLSISGFGLVGGNGENVGMLIAILNDWSERKKPNLSLDHILREVVKICDRVPEGKISAFTPPAIMGLGVTGGVSFMLQSTGEQTPVQLSSVLRGFLNAINQLPESMYAFSMFYANTPELYLDINRPKAEALNVQPSDVFATLQSNFASFYVNDFNLFGRAYRVKIQNKANNRTTINDIETTDIMNSKGKLVPLSAIAKIRYEVGARRIERFNQFMAAEIDAMAAPGVSSGTLMDKLGKLANNKLPPNYQIAWTGMSYQERSNQGKVAMLMVLALLFGYLFLVGQYESWSVPASIISSISIAILGAFLGLAILNMPLSIYAQLGLVMLVGLASKNAILIVEFSKRSRENNMSIYDAALNGARVRYRAVLMTAYSFILGVFPMVIATGAGAGSRQSIGVTTFAGMIAATLFGIIFVPVLYFYIQTFSEKINAFFKKKVIKK